MSAQGAGATGVPADVRGEVLEFLHHEAELLDDGRLDEWLELLTEDVSYAMPVRLTRERGQEPAVSAEMQFFQDDLATLRLRVRRLRTDFAWAEDPPSRTRHFVANARVAPGPTPDEVDVRCNVLVYRNRGASAASDLISGERRDRLRRVGGAWKLARRVFVPDQATLGVDNLAIFV
ncbi:MAG: 3-phenylpropionate/cinnamic acid dioxygenase subunit beta [Armatimonadota bacterium]|nr:3-phenylpropionate/cinnamic acid dioxygenase subunit beta [Armatimonadota bacterium]